MAHNVICKYCGKTFDADKEEYKKEANRYVHLKCWNDKQNESGYRIQIHDLMRQLLQDGYSKYKIDKQIKQFVDDGKTISGIYKTLDYWYNIKKADTSKANGGIGIVPFVYQEARNYWKEQAKNQENFQKVEHQTAEEAKELFSSPKIYKRKKVPIRKPTKVTYFELD